MTRFVMASVLACARGEARRRCAARTRGADGAAQYLGCPASSAAVERLFSALGIAFAVLARF